MNTHSPRCTDALGHAVDPVIPEGYARVEDGPTMAGDMTWNRNYLEPDKGGEFKPIDARQVPLSVKFFSFVIRKLTPTNTDYEDEKAK